MATKRPAPAVHPSRQEQVPEEPRRKRQKPDNLGSKSYKKAHASNDLNKQVRSLKRLLEQNDVLPADIRIEKERALQSVQHELDETLRAKRKSDMIGRYHMVRFFDRQKATKRLKRARKALSQCVAEPKGKSAELERKVQEGEVDVNYAMYYPLDVRYRALFPTERKKSEEIDENAEDGAGAEAAEAERKGDPEMWQRVKQCMADGTLDALRNGTLTSKEEEAEKRAVPAIAANTKKKRQKQQSAGAADLHGNRRERRSAAAAVAIVQAESDDENGIGFFSRDLPIR